MLRRWDFRIFPAGDFIVESARSRNLLGIGQLRDNYEIRWVDEFANEEQLHRPESSLLCVLRVNV